MNRCPKFHPRGGRCSLEQGHALPHKLDFAEHRCHARGCTTAVKPEMLMCLPHWRMVPRDIQIRVWAYYRPGQCEDKRPSEAWHEAADAAILAVAEKEGL